MRVNQVVSLVYSFASVVICTHVKRYLLFLSLQVGIGGAITGMMYSACGGHFAESRR